MVSRLSSKGSRDCVAVQEVQHDTDVSREPAHPGDLHAQSLPRGESHQGQVDSGEVN